jgi:hypothetical protein
MIGQVALREDAMRWVTTAAAIEIAVTSLILLVLFGRLIFGAELSEPGQALGRC